VGAQPQPVLPRPAGHAAQVIDAEGDLLHEDVQRMQRRGRDELRQAGLHGVEPVLAGGVRRQGVR
jgi:hypothetical protein